MNSSYDYHYMMNSEELFKRVDFDPHQYGFFLSNNSVDNINLIHVINGGFSSVTHAISSSGNSTFSDGFILALVGAFSAFAFNLVQRIIESKSTRLSKSGDAMLLLIKEFEDITVRYWIKGHHSTTPDQESNASNEIIIKAMLMTIDKNMKVIIKNLPLKNKNFNKVKLEAFSSDVYDLATGDDFEAEERPSNKTKAFAISKKCSEARAIILGLV
ncbi:DUF1659 domain-containing protein [Citrobacter sp. BDA59-3]|uniref:DUF1659 domain-containing protein n=1 Tax=Citrobacter sp. BDA59-3 TaxID=2781952 RepID=UPI00187DE058|nr:DUF1659 domain-containing protein [Citrobacter sp. BDA59-3]QOV67789.1 DUF1659 domain-containing protein [Citrobacter sp. BDA59-3]